MKIENLLNSPTSLHFNAFTLNFYYLDHQPVLVIHGEDNYSGLAILGYPKLNLIETNMQNGVSAINELIKGCVVKRKEIAKRYEEFQEEIKGQDEETYSWRSEYV